MIHFEEDKTQYPPNLPLWLKIVSKAIDNKYVGMFVSYGLALLSVVVAIFVFMHVEGRTISFAGFNPIEIHPPTQAELQSHTQEFFKWINIYKTGVIHVKTYPATAQIFLNGKRIPSKQNPFTGAVIEGVLPGVHTLTITSPSFLPYQRKIVVKPNKVTNLTVFLLKDITQQNPKPTATLPTKTKIKDMYLVDTRRVRLITELQPSNEHKSIYIAQYDLLGRKREEYSFEYNTYTYLNTNRIIKLTATEATSNSAPLQKLIFLKYLPIAVIDYNQVKNLTFTKNLWGINYTYNPPYLTIFDPKTNSIQTYKVSSNNTLNHTWTLLLNPTELVDISKNQIFILRPLDTSKQSLEYQLFKVQDTGELEPIQKMQLLEKPKKFTVLSMSFWRKTPLLLIEYPGKTEIIGNLLTEDQDTLINQTNLKQATKYNIQVRKVNNDLEGLIITTQPGEVEFLYHNKFFIVFRTNGTIHKLIYNKIKTDPLNLLGNYEICKNIPPTAEFLNYHQTYVLFWDKKDASFYACEVWGNINYVLQLSQAVFKPVVWNKFMFFVNTPTEYSHQNEENTYLHLNRVELMVK